MLSKILIANRSEIALRIIRACRELGVKTVTIFSDADRSSRHVSASDESYPIGPAPVSESYLNSDRIVELASKVGADSIHPGYGFLAENHDFADKCEKQGIIFIGPSSKTLALAGDKLTSREVLRKNGIAVLPGSREVIVDSSRALDVAEDIGWPLLLKAAYGGGGRGIRIANSAQELEDLFDSANMEAKGAFGMPGMYLEKYLKSPRHIEFQILRDKKGHCVHLGERECSIQRRFQKLVELSPSPIVGPKTRAQVGEIAKKVARIVEFQNAGTMEFLVDQDLNFYFIEINARLQVEHAVTEMVTGVDIVKEQIRIASGSDLSVDQRMVCLRGAAIEFRINAEDVTREFQPVTGNITDLDLPGGPGVRLDTAIYSGYHIPEYYDSMVAKLIVWGCDAMEAQSRAHRALSEFIIGGIRTTIPLYLEIMRCDAFARGELSTDFIEREHLVEKMSKKNIELSDDYQIIAGIASAIHLSGKAQGLSSPKQAPVVDRKTKWCAEQRRIEEKFIGYAEGL